MTTLYDFKKDLIQTVELTAIAVMRIQDPAFDEVNKTEAYEIAGSRRWLDFHIKRGNIKPKRRGASKNSPIFFSRLDIHALKFSEKSINQIIKQ
jgi:hypothetical protein